MRISEIRSFFGPNIHSHESVLVMSVDLENTTLLDARALRDALDRALCPTPGGEDGHHQDICSLLIGTITALGIKAGLERSEEAAIVGGISDRSGTGPLDVRGRYAIRNADRG